MIFNLDSKEGSDLFTKNNQGYLIYEWSRVETPAVFDYKVISDNISSNPSFVSHENIIHIFFIDGNQTLVHKKINKLFPEENHLQLISEDMESSITPAAYLRDH